MKSWIITPHKKLECGQKIKTCKVQKFEGGKKKKKRVKEEDTVCMNSDKFKVIYKHQKFFVQEVEGSY